MLCTSETHLTQSMVDWLNSATSDGSDALTLLDAEQFNSVFRTSFVKLDLLNAWRRTMEHPDFQAVEIYRSVLSRLRKRYSTIYITRRNTEANCSGVSPSERLEQLAAEEEEKKVKARAKVRARSRAKGKRKGKAVKVVVADIKTENLLETILETDSESIMDYVAGASLAKHDFAPR